MASVIEFSSKAHSFSEFSNFHVAPFEIEGKAYKTVEHWFQAQKFPTDKDLQERIRNERTPAKAKELGQTESTHYVSNWDVIKDEVMLKGLTAKFAQNPDLMDLLVSTAGHELREKTVRDVYWGTGQNGDGQNKLGKLLMVVRDR
jgi:hypothetical protein